MRTALLLAAIFVAATVEAQTLRPYRTSAPPIIDGSLDDPVWKSAPMVTGLKTFAPDFDKDQEQKTEVLMAYDAENLYFAYRCFDDRDKIKTSMAARDNMRSDDWVCLNLDTFGDAQGLTALYINPFGIQQDSRFAGGREDFSVDFVWYSGGRLTPDGYDVEIALPLKSIRYADTDTVIMTVFFERFISRRNEHGSYPAMDPKKGFAFLPQMTPMEYVGLEHYTLLELLPAVTFAQQSSHANGKLGVSGVRREASLTGKYGITSDLILDATYNPDFSQVEADAGQVDVNLRFGLFFPEKRPFFLEGREVFNIGATSVTPLDPIQSIVHTRTIVNPLIGTKVSGKIGDKNTVALLYANDELGNSAAGAPTEAQFAVLRYKRSLTEDSFMGGMATTREAGSGYNRVAGVDAQIREKEGAMFEAHAFGSQFRDSSSVPEMADRALGVKYGLVSRDIDYSASIKDVGRDFRADMGYITRTGITTYAASVTPKLYPESKLVNRIDVGVFSAQSRDRSSGMWETMNTLSSLAYIRGNLLVLAQATYSTEIFLDRRFQTSGLFMRGGGQFSRPLGVTLIFSGNKAIFYSGNPYQGTNRRASAIITYQPSDQLRIDYSFTYVDFTADSADVKVFEYPINRLKLTYQVDKYLFFRAIGEYNGFRKQLLTDYLASFTYIPGTVMHAGYGSLYNRVEWDGANYRPGPKFLETNRGFFFKASYLWRM